jgi:urease accessory protein
MSAAPLARGWRARLKLAFEAAATGTQLTRREHEGPLRVQRAFYPEGAAGAANGPCHVYIVHPPGGVASGDELELEVAVGAGAHALLTTPAAGKFYRRGPAGPAGVRQDLHVAEGALEWLPQENIFYPNAAVALRSIVHLSGAARFIGWEIGCLGLPASAQGFDHGTLRLHFELRRQQQPLLLERLTMTRENLQARWGLGGHVAFGTALAFPAGAAELALAREAAAAVAAEAACGAAAADCAARLLACTLVEGVLVCRATARRTDHLKQAFVRWWQAVRPAVLGREAVSPRIWST